MHVVIVVNNSDDGSAHIAAEAAARHPNLILDLIEVDFPAETAHVGSARRLAMERASRATTDPARSVLLTTDADATPTTTWIEANLRAVDLGADVVGGHIVGNEAEEVLLGTRFLQRAARQARYQNLVDRLAALIDPLPFDPWPRHCDHTGASLAVRGDVYAAVGGMPALPFREDLAFVSRVRSAGYRLRHSSDVRVKVSARLDGRAPGGMAECIRSWVWAEANDLPHFVENPHSVAARLSKRRSYRDLAFTERRKLSLAAHASGSASASSTMESVLSPSALIELFAPDEPDAPSNVPAETAITEIEGVIADTENEIRVS